MDQNISDVWMLSKNQSIKNKDQKKVLYNKNLLKPNNNKDKSKSKMKFKLEKISLINYNLNKKNSNKLHNYIYII